MVMRGMARLLSSGGDDGRISADIDILVPASAREAAVAALTGLGYEIMKGLNDHPRPVVVGRTRDVGTIDVHAALLPEYMRLSYESLTEHCSVVRTGTGEVLVPSATCQLMFNIVHDQLHDGDYWRGVIDVRHLLDLRAVANEGIDWQLLEQLFPPGCARHALHVQLGTATGLLNVAIPEAVCGGTWSRLQRVRRRYQLSRPILASLFTGVTVLLDPPPDGAGIRTRSGERRSRLNWPSIRRRISRGIFPVNYGKL